MNEDPTYEEIMLIDEELIKLVLKRVEVLRHLDYSRVKQVLNSRRIKVAEVLSQKYSLPHDDLVHIISYVDGATLKVIKPIFVGFLGPRGSFAEEASLKVFNSQGASLVTYNSIRDVFRSVETEEVDYGVVPLENSLEGSVGETLDMLAQSSVKICGETEVRISLNLIAKPGTKIEDVMVVLSHPMALAQCRNFIYTKLKNIVVETRSSTSEAVKEAVERSGVAAIG
ncbi:MAG: prephenate dehydratase domain-containing protein, partial [Ignisphaera sp.]